MTKTKETLRNKILEVIIDNCCGSPECECSSDGTFNQLPDAILALFTARKEELIENIKKMKLEIPNSTEDQTLDDVIKLIQKRTS